MTVRVVERRGERRLVIDIVFKNPDGTRGRYRHDAQVQTMQAARAEERRRLAALAATGTPWGLIGSPAEPERPAKPKPEDSGPTFKKVAEDYLETFAVSQLKPSTRRGYRVVIESCLVPRIGSKRITEIDAVTVRELDADLVKRGLKKNSRRNVQAILRSIVCRYAVECKLLPEAPKLPKMGQPGKTVFRGMPPEDVSKIIEAAGAPYRLALLLAVNTGLRAGEIRGLRWRDVDLKAGKLCVRQSICRGEEAPPKSGHEREIPLTDEVRAALEAVKVRPRDAFVSAGPDGKAWTEFALHKAFKRACGSAGLQGWRLHDLRHYFVTSLFRVGVGAHVVQQLAGHVELSTTQRYAHAGEADREDAIRRLCGNSVVTGSATR